MNKFLKNLHAGVTRNLPWKIAAFLLALILWVLILNAIDPVRSFQVELPLTLRNDDLLDTELSHVHIENLNELRNTRVVVTIRGNSRTIDELRPQLTAYADLAISHVIAAAAGEGSITLHVNVEGYGSDVDRISTTPSSVRLTLDTIVTEYFDVHVRTNGEVDEDYFLQTQGITAYPTQLPLTGPSRLLQMINRLVVDVNVSDSAGTVSLADQSVMAVNAFNSPVGLGSSALINEGVVHVEVPVYRRAFLQVLEPFHQGAPPTGFGVYGFHLTPQFFEVAGSPEAIANLAAVRLSPIGASLINYSTENVNLYYDINDLLPDGVFLIHPEYHVVRVEVIIEPFVSRNFTISRYDIQVLGLAQNTTILTDFITFSVTGLRSVMYEDFEITATANIGVMARDPGQHTILVTFSGVPDRTTISPSVSQITIYVSDTSGDLNGENGDSEYNGYDDYNNNGYENGDDQGDESDEDDDYLDDEDDEE